MGRNAHESVRRHFLANRHSLQYIDLLASLLGERSDGATGSSPSS
jgi:hypothetical protein